VSLRHRRPRAPVLIGQGSPAPVRHGLVRGDAECLQGVDPFRLDGAQVQPAVAEVELVGEPLPAPSRAKVKCDPSSMSSSRSSSGSGRPTLCPSPSPSQKWCRCARSQRANPASIPSARAANVWLRAAANTRPGRGQKSCPRPDTSSTLIDNHVLATPGILPRGPRLGALSARSANELHTPGFHVRTRKIATSESIMPLTWGFVGAACGNRTHDLRITRP
jgi:hypothetical protein